MKKLLKWIGLTLGTLVGLLVLALIAVYAISMVRLNKQYTTPATALTIPADAATMAEGKRQFSTRGCVDCHGADGAGKLMIDDPLMGTVMAANLTAGAGGVGQAYSDADWARAIRHGVGPDGRGLVIMPSHEYYPIRAVMGLVFPVAPCLVCPAQNLIRLISPPMPKPV